MTLQFLSACLYKLRRRPQVSLILLLCFTLGIGANVAIFSLVNSVLLRRLPYPSAERLVRITESRNDLGPDQAPFDVTPLTYEQLQTQRRLFADLAAFTFDSFNVTGTGESERFEGASASASLPRVLGVRPHLGRFFSPEEDRPGSGARVVVLAQGLWERRFGGDPATIGRTLSLNGEPYAIVGVMPAGLGFPDDAELWVPLALDTQQMPARTKRTLTVVASLQPGTTVDGVAREMSALARRLETELPDSHAGWGLRLTSLREDMIGTLRPILLVLWATVTLVLLITCGNVGSLLLSRATAESYELAVRAAFGASRSRLIAESLGYVFLLALLGTGLGVVLASALIPALIRISGVELSSFQAAHTDARVLGYSLLLILLVVLLSGLLPALRASRPDLYRFFKESGPGVSAGLHGRRIQRLLVSAQIALAVVLSIGALLMVKSFQRISNVELGFETENVLTFEIFPPPSTYPERHQKVAFFERVLATIRSLPGVEAAGTSSTLPLSTEPVVARFSIEGRPPASADEVLQANHRRVSDGYLTALRIAVVEGRGLTPQDDADAPPVVVISREMAQRFWPGERVLGKRIKRGAPDSDKPWMTIVGVAEDVRDLEIGGETGPTWYLPYAQHDFTTMSVAVRTRQKPAALLPAIRGAVRSIDRTLPLYNVATTAEIASRSLSQQRVTAVLLGVFAGVALLLSSLGVYGVTAYGVSQRVHELGVRRCLGAQRGDVLRLVLSETMLLTAIGLVVGLASARMATKLLESLLYQVQPTDPAAFVATPLLLVALTLLAGLIPARRAIAVDPLLVLRGGNSA